MPLKLAKFVYPEVLAPRIDLGLLVLRVATILPLFLKHGLEKIFNFSQMAQQFPDPLHIGMVPTLVIAYISDAICSVLVMLGVATRWAALYMFANLLVAWSLRQGFLFWSRQNWHGEMTVVYLGALLAILFLGPGKYSIDGLILRRLGREQSQNETR
jgi:putative oxidoreductase